MSDADKLEDALIALVYAAKQAVWVMTQYGNQTGWPADMPDIYAETINMLREAEVTGAHILQPKDGQK